ncbi:Arm DNA-binding domain-containing protein, partial [Nevskia sp.]|uniref:Arm DNA-binding domain-containing protein n=1 Tax=Nevskia sp. TaxID=1929292 RepID=UPI0025F50253
MAAKLTELEIKNAKPKADKYTMAAGHGLTLIVMPDGSKYWRQRFSVGGKRKMMTVGRPYPETTLKQALARSAELRALTDQGTDPSEKRRT